MARRLARSTEWVEDALRAERGDPAHWNIEFEKNFEEALRMRIAAERLRAVPAAPKPEAPRIPCPLCGSPTTGLRDWYGMHYREGLRQADRRKPYIGPRENAWDCLRDHRHYLWVRSNEMLKARGGKPKSLAEWEAYDGPAVAAQRLEALRNS